METQAIDLTIIENIESTLQTYTEHIESLKKFINAKDTTISQLEEAAATAASGGGDTAAIDERIIQLTEEKVLAQTQLRDFKDQVQQYNTRLDDINNKLTNNNIELSNIFNRAAAPAEEDWGHPSSDRVKQFWKERDRAEAEEKARVQRNREAAEEKARRDRAAAAEGGGGVAFNFNKNSHKYKCVLSKGNKYYYKRVNNKWKRISNKEGFKMEKSRLKL